MPNESEVTFTITGKANTWLGIGLGVIDMVNADMIIVQFKTGNEYTLMDAWSTMNGAVPQEDTALSGKNDLTGIKANNDANGNPTVTFTRKLNTGDSKDYILKTGTSTNIILAWGNGTIKDHGSNVKKDTFTLTAPTTNITPSAPSASTSSSTLQLNFFFILLISITILLF
jgi:hypothetical protein